MKNTHTYTHTYTSLRHETDATEKHTHVCVYEGDEEGRNNWCVCCKAWENVVGVVVIIAREVCAHYETRRCRKTWKKEWSSEEREKYGDERRENAEIDWDTCVRGACARNGGKACGEDDVVVVVSDAHEWTCADGAAHVADVTR